MARKLHMKYCAIKVKVTKNPEKMFSFTATQAQRSYNTTCLKVPTMPKSCN